MSAKSNAWVWHTCPAEVDGIPIDGSLHKILLVLSDISDDDGNVIYASAKKRTRTALASKSRLSESTFYRASQQLESLGLLTVTRVGLMNQYRIMMDDFPAAAPTTGQNDLLATTGQNDLLATTAGQGDLNYRSAVTAHKRINKNKTLSPVNNATIEGGPQSDDRESIHLGWRARRRAAHATAELDVDALADMVAPILGGPDGISADRLPGVLRLIAYRVLSRPAAAGRKVDRPTSYVAVAIRNEPEVFRKLAFELEAAA